MIVLTDTTGITIKSRIQDISHVRIGLTEIMYWVSGYERVRSVWPLTKPHDQLTLEELGEKLLNLQMFQRLHNVDN